MGNTDKNKYKYIFIFSIYKPFLFYLFSYFFIIFLSYLELLVIIIKYIFPLEL